MIAWFAAHPLGLKIVLGVVGALLLCFSLWLLWLRKYLEWQNLKTLDIQERVGLKIEFIKTAAQIVGGLFFILTILVAYRNYEISQKNYELSRKNLEATQKKNEADLEQAREKQVTELYVKAIEQLGSDKLPVILGGIYALERIARDSEKYHGPIMEVFTAYVRQNAPWPPEDPAQARKRRPWTKKGLKAVFEPKKGKKDTGRREQGQAATEEETRPEPDTDIQAVLTVIGRLGPAYDEQGRHQPLDLTLTDLLGAFLMKAHLEGAYLTAAHLEGAVLERACLEKALLRKAHLEKASLYEAHVEEAVLIKAHLEKADLRGAHLWGAHLEGAYLETASGLTQAQIDKTYCDYETKLPPDLKCEKPGP